MNSFSEAFVDKPKKIGGRYICKQQKYISLNTYQ